MIREIDGIYVDAFALFSCFKDEPYPFLLESGMCHDDLGRYSIIGWDPFLLFKSKEGSVEVKHGGKVEVSEADPFDLLKEYMEKYRQISERTLPFTGGAVGYFSYDLKNLLEKLPRTAAKDVDICDMHFGFYDETVIIDHRDKKTYAATYGITGKKESILDGICKRVKTYFEKSGAVSSDIGFDPQDREETSFTSNFTKEDYLKALDKIHEYIRQGDIYQTNLTQRFTADLKTTPEKLYRVLRKVNPAPFASFIPMDEGVIVSSSPERFMRLTGKNAETRPIKGTLPRGKTAAEDEANKKALSASEKDKAELLMIVDLERNDLGRVAKTGSVEVTELYNIETYPTVFHLVSTVKAELKEQAQAVDLVKATFPGGSITGAPKIRAMEIIDELEPTERNIYTGSIGYLDFNGDMDLNIVIRTILCKGKKAYFQAGGGIVWDSDNELEYEETYHKAAALMKSIEIANKLGD
ncbi:aminodeoxychorismate synthase component I [Alkalibacter saccharofermentans]|uniref:aminodeoxychorismate synthase n=1 Tax=Alkalibacter saccharofermentans DSM 14828 TaxID=1120975 RepID=A0A1M4TPJ3_9FIRM|nr:aminodeoxychorismate synthase component I [Alkalibacter saccharofermentans]SHE46439.1 aminodeoxychorismate synthase, subunit I [Alkalibacter saccharofermentans DSM 14828]